MKIRVLVSPVVLAGAFLLTHAAQAKTSAPKETPQPRSRADAATRRAASTFLPTKTESTAA